MSTTGASASVAPESSHPNYHPSFNSQDAEIVFISDDGVLFRVHKFVLHFRSGFFKGMLEMPRDSAEATANEPIRIQESSKIFAMLLDIIYPGHEPPSLDSLEIANDVMQAAEKYEIRKATNTVRNIVMAQRKFHIHQPLEVYALASRYDWEEAAKTVSTETLKFDLYHPDYSASLKQLDSSMSLRLFDLHARRRRELMRALDPGAATSTKVQWPNIISLPTSCSQNHYYIENVCRRPWMILKGLVAQAVEFEPRGDAIRRRSFMDHEALEDMWRYTCASADCEKIVFSKGRLHDELIRLLDLLPSSI